MINKNVTEEIERYTIPINKILISEIILFHDVLNERHLSSSYKISEIYAVY